MDLYFKIGLSIAIFGMTCFAIAMLIDMWVS